MRILYTLVCLLAFNLASAQISFQRTGSDYTTNFRSGVAVVSTDMNGDTYDDLVRLNDATDVKVHLQGQGGSLFESYTNEISGGGSWNAIAGDVNNDGWPDIVTSGAYDKVKVFYANPFQHNFQRVSLEGENFFAQGSNLVDINNDGFLDIFVCDDNATSDIYMNDSTGGFNVVDTIIDFTTTPPSDNSGNYGSIWNDFDNDGDLDLYIAKCRQGVTDPEDPRRINALFVNMGDTAYVEMADSFGIAVGWQSWSPDFADTDNDGDLDLFITNHDATSQLFENIDGERFEDVTLNSGIVVSGLAIQSVFHDFDNDGLVDLLIGGTNSALYHNIGDNQFLPVANPFPGRNVTSYALGDLNADGFMDVYATYNALFNSPSDTYDDAIWIQDPNDNNYVRVHLMGTTCNRSAVGARIQVYGDWGMQMREIQAGESYGITNSLIQMFGLGQNESIDSLSVRWPNGLSEMYYNLPVNTTLTIQEGGCLRPVFEIDQGPFTQCANDTFELQAPDGYAAYQWSNGMVSQGIQVSVPGIYHVSLTDDQGCITISTPIEVRDDEQSNDDAIVIAGRAEVCYGDTVTIIAPEGEAYEWNDGTQQQELGVVESGTYFVTVMRSCGELTTAPVTISVVDPTDFTVEGDTIFGTGSGELTAQGDSIVWYADMNATEPLGTGTPFITPLVDTSTVFYAENIKLIPGLNVQVGMTAHGGGTMYNGDQFNGNLVFDVYEPLRIDSVLVMTEFPGDREVVIMDEYGSDVFRQRFTMDTGMYYLPLKVQIEPGVDYQIGTDGTVNNEQFGTNSPKLVRSDGEVAFPYTVEDVIEIKSTQFGEDFYYYFYDWHVQTMEEVCISDRLAAEVVVTDSSTQVLYLDESALRVYPNPVSSILQIEANEVQLLSGSVYRIYTIDGKLVKSGDYIGDTNINVQSLNSGLYLFELRSKDLAAVTRFVKE